MNTAGEIGHLSQAVTGAAERDVNSSVVLMANSGRLSSITAFLYSGFVEGTQRPLNPTKHTV